MESKTFNRNYKVKVVGTLDGKKVNSLCGYARFIALFGAWGIDRLRRFDECGAQSRTFSLRSQSYKMYVTAY